MSFSTGPHSSLLRNCASLHSFVVRASLKNPTSDSFAKLFIIQLKIEEDPNDEGMERNGVERNNVGVRIRLRKSGETERGTSEGSKRLP